MTHKNTWARVAAGCGVAALFLVRVAAAAEPPATDIATIPAYPGAKAQPVDSEMPAGSAERRYTTVADLDKVLAFYQQKYPGFRLVKPGDPMIDSCSNVPAPGAWTEGWWGTPDNRLITVGVDCKGADVYGDGCFRKLSDAEALGLMRQLRGPRANNLWRDSAMLVWCQQPDANRYFRARVSLVASVDANARKYETQIRIERNLEGVDANFESSLEESEGYDAAGMAEMAEAMKRAGADPKLVAQIAAANQAASQKTAALHKSHPTEKDVGVPLYPGALFDVERTAALTTMVAAVPGLKLFRYVSRDEPGKVAGFYEQKTGKKAGPYQHGQRVVVRPASSPELPKLAVDFYPLDPQNENGMQTEILITRCDSCK